MISQEDFNALPRAEQLRIVAKTYGDPIPPRTVREEVRRRETRRAQNIPLTEDYEPADRCNLTLMGPPRSKKNNLVALGVQSPAYRKYHADALDQLKFVRKLQDADYNLCADFYVDGYGKNADLLGLLQALADTLQAARVVSNDKQFKGFDGSRVHYDYEGEPRTEISVRPLSEENAA